MVIQLNPLLPMVWRSPDTVQVGIDQPVAVVTGVTAGLEAVLWALRSGLPRSGAIFIGTEAGASVAAVERLIDDLGPALWDSVLRDPAPITAPVPEAVVVDGDGPTADRLRSELRDLGVPVASPPDQDPAARTALAVLLGHFVLEPARHSRWLRRDVPHLPVIFSDTEIRIGPLVDPGFGPCLACVERDHVDRDPAWPAVAAQLLSRRAATETAQRAIEVSLRVAVLVHAHTRTGTSDLDGTPLVRPSLVIDARTGLLRRRAHRPHEKCGCRSLPESATAPGQSAAVAPASTS